MSIVENSIKSHRKTFKLLIVLHLVMFLINVYFMVKGNHKFFALSFVVFSAFLIWMIAPTIQAYRSWKFIVKNKKELEVLNINTDKKYILSLKSIFN